jgi:hypothetical protein
MLRMKRRVMRRLQSICVINRPEGIDSVPKVLGNRHGFANRTFGTLVVRNVASGRTSQRVCLGDGTFLLKPLGRMKNVPKGQVVSIWNISTNDWLERKYAFVNNPSGRFLC